MVATARMNTELLIRLLEWAREDAKADVPLHVVAENVEKLKGKTLTMKDYAALIPGPSGGKMRHGGAVMHPWIDHVKTYAKQHNISYREALKAAKASYRQKRGRGWWRKLKRFWKNKIVPVVNQVLSAVSSTLLGVDIVKFIATCKRACKEKGEQMYAKDSASREVYVEAMVGAATAACNILIGDLTGGIGEAGAKWVAKNLAQVVRPIANLQYDAIVWAAKKTGGRCGGGDGGFDATSDLSDDDLHYGVQPQINDDCYDELQYAYFKQLSAGDQRAYIKQYGHPPLTPNWREDDMYSYNDSDTTYDVWNG
jgi:hypothetical protein